MVNLTTRSEGKGSLTEVMRAPRRDKVSKKALMTLRSKVPQVKGSKTKWQLREKLEAKP